MVFNYINIKYFRIFVFLKKLYDNELVSLKKKELFVYWLFVLIKF